MVKQKNRTWKLEWKAGTGMDCGCTFDVLVVEEEISKLWCLPAIDGAYELVDSGGRGQNSCDYPTYYIPLPFGSGHHDEAF